MTNSRNKGSTFERDIAKELFLLTGISFKRDLEQYRAADHGDLIPDNDAWPFVLECKRYAAGMGCAPAWKAQASKAAEATSKFPAVVFKFDRRDTRAAVPLAAIGYDTGEWIETTLDGLAYLAREIMAEDWRKLQTRIILREAVK